MHLRYCHSGLKISQAPVEAGYLVLVPGSHALVAEQSQSASDLVVARCDEAALAAGDVLGAIKRERSDAEAADASTVADGAVRLCGILYDRESMPGGEVLDRGHIGGQAV
jgi:hypothetical protein